MNIFSFAVEFSSEKACIEHFKTEHFKTERDKIGVKCKCGETDFFWIKSRLSYECITLKSSAIMQNSNLSFLTWYKAMFL